MVPDGHGHRAKWVAVNVVLDVYESFELVDSGDVILFSNKVR